MNKIFTLGLTLLLSGCAYQMQMMPRDSGTVYKGSVASNGMGTGNVTVALDGRICEGKFTQTASGDSFGFYQSYGSRGATSSGIVQSTSGAGKYKALLSCSDGTGLRCDVEGGQSGGGICVDSKNRVYDMIYQ
jgi:hypothetical protein